MTGRLRPEPAGVIPRPAGLSAALLDPTRSALVLDGGLSTELERRGHDLSGPLWSARLLSEAPASIVEAHLAFLQAGAEVITTASYQASLESFSRAGIDPVDGAGLLTQSVALARQAIELAEPRHGERDRPWVAGSVGPFGASLANGSEYTGDYGDDVDLRRLREFHRPQLEILTEAGVDVLAVETIPSLLETEALLLELAALNQPSWLSLTTVLGSDGTVLTRRGEPAEQAFAMAADVDAIIAVGINCTSPEGLDTAIELAARTSGKPVVAYPNSGESWDGDSRTWVESRSAGYTSADLGESKAQAWLDAGARLIGGCCRVSPGQIAELARALGLRT